MRTARPAGWRPLIAGVRADARDHDVLLVAAGATFYFAVSVVPLILVAMRLASVVGSRLPWINVALSALPASLYGEGLRRALGRFSPKGRPQRDAPPWRARLLVLASCRCPRRSRSVSCSWRPACYSSSTGVSPRTGRVGGRWSPGPG